MGSLNDHKNGTLPGIGSIADRELLFWADPSVVVPMRAAGVGSVQRAINPVVTGTFDSLALWRGSLARVRQGTDNARVVVMGDSTVGGIATSFIDRALEIWRARMDRVWQGAVYTPNPAKHYEPRVVAGAGWSLIGVGDFGLAQEGLLAGAVGAGGSLDIGPFYCDRFEFSYLGAAAASFDWWIDAGAHTNVVVPADAAIPSHSLETPAVAVGNHTLHIGNIAGNTVFPFHFEPRVGASGLYVSRAGVGATTSVGWTVAADAFDSSTLAFHTLQPDLTIIMLGVGDANTQVSLATFRANIDAMVVLGKLYGSVVLVVAPTPTLPAAYPLKYESYIAQLESIRDSRDVAMLNFANHFAGLDSADYMADTLHPSVTAQGDMAIVAAQALIP